jgi:hypothetical protein
MKIWRVPNVVFFNAETIPPPPFCHLKQWNLPTSPHGVITQNKAFLHRRENDFAGP